MISFKELRKKAEQKYPTFLRAWLEEEESFFPLEIPVGRPSKRFQQFQNEVRALQKKEGKGYTLRMVTRNTRDFGEQTFPTHVIFADHISYLQFLGKQKEFERFVHDVEYIWEHLGIYIWVRNNVKLILDHLGKWKQIVHVCEYFKETPQPNLYLRELPIRVDTKFIESHRRIVDSMLMHLLPPEVVNIHAQSFEERFSIQTPEPQIRFRILDSDLWEHMGLPFNDMSVLLSQMQAYSLAPHRCLIVENLMSYLTLPTVPHAFAIFGGGMSIKARELTWLEKCPIYFWGDLDVQGFQILSLLREVFPHTQSILMDAETLAEHQEFVVEGKPIPQTALPHLTPAEREIYKHLHTHNHRLEQERLWYSYILARFEAYLGI